MIVKTGANYQDEGGYIEASARGFLYTLTANDKSVSFGGSEELGPLTVPIKIINETGRSLSQTCLFSLGGIGNVLGTAPVLGVGETKTIDFICIIGLPMRILYSGDAAVLKCDSEYVTIKNSGSNAAFSIVKIPENGEPITMRLYI